MRHFLFISTFLSSLLFSSAYAIPTQADQTQTETSAVSQNHQADFDLFIGLMEQVDMQKMTMMSEEGEDTASAEQKAQVAEVIENLKALGKSLDQAQFTTPEGKKVQTAFIAYNNDSIYLLKNQAQWENDEKQKEKLVMHSMQLNQNLIEALQDLKTRAGQ